MVNFKKCLQCEQKFDTDEGRKRNNKFCDDECAKYYYDKRQEILLEPINEEKFNILLTKHKQTIRIIGRVIKGRLFGVEGEKYTHLFISVKKQAHALCIISARYKCEDCGSEHNLTIHHIITRINKQIMRSFSKYLTSRHYWSNQILLCSKCHNKAHENDMPEEFEMKTISQDAINKLKEEYQPQNGNTKTTTKA